LAIIIQEEAIAIEDDEILEVKEIKPEKEPIKEVESI